MLLRVLHEVPNDQKVAGIPHPLNHFDLMPKPLFVIRKAVLQFTARGSEIPNLGFAGLITVSNDLLEVLICRKARIRFGNGIVR